MNTNQTISVVNPNRNYSLWARTEIIKNGVPIDILYPVSTDVLGKWATDTATSSPATSGNTVII